MTEVIATILRHLVIARIGLLCVIKEKKLASEYYHIEKREKWYFFKKFNTVEVTVDILKFQNT